MLPGDKHFLTEKAQWLCCSRSLEASGSLTENRPPTEASAQSKEGAPGPRGPFSTLGASLLPPQGEGTLVLQLDGRVPLLGQHVRLLQQALVLLLQLLQAAQVRVVDGNLLTVPLAQGVVVLLDHLQLVHGRVVQLAEDF